MAVGRQRRRMGLLASCVVAVPLFVFVLAQVFLPSLAAHRIRERVARYGTVHSVSLSAWPAIELLWGKVDSVSVRAGMLTATPSQIAARLWEARDAHDMTVSADAARLRLTSLPNGLTVSGVRMRKHGSAIAATATLTQAQLDAALPAGFRVEPVASGEGQVRVRASGGLFGVQASISVLVEPVEGQLVAVPQGIPFGGLASVTLFSDPHLAVRSVGLRVLRSQPLTYGLSLSAILR